MRGTALAAGPAAVAITVATLSYIRARARRSKPLPLDVNRARVESAIRRALSALFGFHERPAEREPLAVLASNIDQKSLPAVLLESHIKARGQDNGQYPQRQPVPDHLVAWDVAFEGYAPKEWTHAHVLDNDRERSSGAKWADPPHVARAGLEGRFSYAGDGEPKPVALHDGYPRNPVGRTGLRGRGLLGKWGPNHAADPIITRYHPTSGQLQVVAIQRKDTSQWAIPGGM
eukprot:1269025-Prymnesium_polylepis.1